MMRETLISGSESEISGLIEDARGEIFGVLDDETAEELFLLSMIESLNNAVEHGNGHDESKMIRAAWHFGGQTCMAQISDQGSGFTSRPIELREVTGKRGRGLPLMQKNSDMVIFNTTGNSVMLIKGGSPMNAELEHAKASLRTLPGDIFLASDFRPDNEKPFSAVAELFDKFNSNGARHIFADLKYVKLLSSTSWGTIFAEAARDEVETIVLFNSGPALVASARQMGLDKRKDYCRKIKVLPDSEEAFRMLVETLPG
jgi:serine/threonine-protein kinase RsbW